MNLILKQALLKVGAIAAAIAMGILKNVLNSSWTTFWKEILEAVQCAETSFKTAIIKRDWVIAKILDFITQKRSKKLNRIQTWVIKRVAGSIVDEIIKELNRASGKRWIDVVTDLEEKLNDKLKIIEPVEPAALGI